MACLPVDAIVNGRKMLIARYLLPLFNAKITGVTVTTSSSSRMRRELMVIVTGKAVAFARSVW
ncbi:hypothetical protein FACS1894168_1900 [Deltaproteobacteria bacterium]|nr:hypothetical protein FACS1894168_1900 [Deltaproteobacteria bacterium]